MNVSSSVHGDVTTGCNRSAVSRADRRFSRQMFPRPVCECCIGNNFSIVLLDLYRKESPAISRVQSPSLGALFDVRVHADCLQDPREYWNKAWKYKMRIYKFSASRTCISVWLHSHKLLKHIFTLYQEQSSLSYSLSGNCQWGKY